MESGIATPYSSGAVNRSYCKTASKWGNRTTVNICISLNDASHCL